MPTREEAALMALIAEGFRPRREGSVGRSGGLGRETFAHRVRNLGL